MTSEWLALADLNSRQYTDLEAAGVSREAITVAGGTAWACVSTAGRVFTRSQAGDIHLVQPVWDGPAPSIYEGVEHPILVDLIAWRLDDPTVWYYRLGGPGAVLGADALDQAHADGTALILRITPLDWLISGCRGTVLLEECESIWCSLDAAEQAADTDDWWRGAA